MQQTPEWGIQSLLLRYVRAYQNRPNGLHISQPPRTWRWRHGNYFSGTELVDLLLYHVLFNLPPSQLHALAHCQSLISAYSWLCMLSATAYRRYLRTTNCSTTWGSRTDKYAQVLGLRTARWSGAEALDTNFWPFPPARTVQ